MKCSIEFCAAVMVNLNSLTCDVSIEFSFHPENFQRFVIFPSRGIRAAAKNLFIVEKKHCKAATWVDYFRRFKFRGGNATCFIANFDKIHHLETTDQVGSAGKWDAVEDVFNERTAKEFILRLEILDDEIFQEFVIG